MKTIYRSDELKIEFGDKVAWVTATGWEDAMFHREGFGELQIYGHGIDVRIPMSENDLREVAGELAHAANALRRYAEGKQIGRPTLPTITKKPTLKVVQQDD